LRCNPERILIFRKFPVRFASPRGPSVLAISAARWASEIVVLIPSSLGGRTVIFRNMGVNNYLLSSIGEK
jgi:hypothetical protein